MKADASVIFEFNADDTKVNAKLAKLKNKVNEVQNELNSKTAQKTSLEKQFDDAKAAAKETEDAIKRLEAERARLSDLAVNYNAESPAEVAAAMDAHGRISEIDAELKAQNAALREQDKITQQIDKEYTKITDRVNTLSGNLDKAKTEAGSFEAQLAFANGPLGRMNAAADKTQKSVSRLRKRILELVKSALLFSVISSGLRSMMTYMGQAAMSNSDFAASLAQLKGALLTAFQPIYEAVLPALITLMNIVSTVISFIAQVFAIFSGKSISQTQDNAEALYGEANAIGAVGGAAKEASRQLASFDEINQLQGTSSGGGGGGAGGSLMPDFDSLMELPNRLKEILFKIQSLKFEWDKGEILKSKDAWITALSGILGALLGGMFGGLKGSAIGLLVGLSLGVTACTFLDDLSNSSHYQNLAIIFLAGLIGAVLGGIFGHFTGGIIGLLVGLSIGITAVRFLDGGFDKNTSFRIWFTVISAILGAVIGALFGGLAGATIGLAAGIAISIISTTFADVMDGSAKLDASKALKSVLTAIIVALVASAFGGPVLGIAAGIITLGVGLVLSITSTKVNNLSSAMNSVAKGVAAKASSLGGAGRGGSNMRVTSAVVGNIPALAQGAVIPPNREFMAVLGDQKSGTNIETPLATMIEAFKTAMRDMDTGGRGEAVLYIGEQEMGKLVYRLNKAETRRIGVSLSEG